MPRTRDPRRRGHGLVASTALLLVSLGCGAGQDHDAVAACTAFQDHLDSMRQGDERGEHGVTLE